jgi:hypothetical protein
MVRQKLSDTTNSEALFILRSSLAQELRRVIKTLHFGDTISVTYNDQKALGLVKKSLKYPLQTVNATSKSTN